MGSSGSARIGGGRRLQAYTLAIFSPAERQTFTLLAVLRARRTRNQQITCARVQRPRWARCAYKLTAANRRKPRQAPALRGSDRSPEAPWAYVLAYLEAHPEVAAAAAVGPAPPQA